MFTWDVKLFGYLYFDDFMDKVKGCGQPENLIHDIPTTIWQILTVIVSVYSSMLRPWLRSRLKIKVIEKIFYL